MMRVDPDALEYDVKPQIKNISKYLELGSGSLASISIPSDFSYRSKLINISQVVTDINNRINSIGNWLNTQINNFNDAEYSNKGLVENIGRTSLISSMDGNTYSFGANGEITLDSNIFYDQVKSSINNAYDYLLSGEWYKDYVDMMKKIGAKIVENVKAVDAKSSKNSKKSKSSKSSKEIFNLLLSGKWYKESTDMVKKTLTKTGASTANGVIGIIKGFGEVVEGLSDAVVILDTGIKSSVTGLYALATGNTEEWNSQTKKMWKDTMAYVAEEHVENAYKDFYANTKDGQWLDKNAYSAFKSDGIGTKILSGLGYVTGVTTVSALTLGLISPATVAGVAGAGKATQEYWGEMRDSSWAGINEMYKKGEISKEKYNEYVAIRNLSDEEWEIVKREYRNGEIPKDVFEQMKQIREMPEDWTTLENAIRGIGYGTAVGAWERLQWWAGGKLNNWAYKGADTIKSAIITSGTRITADTVFNAFDTPFRALADASFSDKTFKEAWEKQGGVNAVWTSVGVGLIGSTFGEIKMKPGFMKNIGAHISENKIIKTVKGVLVSPVALGTKFFRSSLSENTHLKRIASQNGLLHFTSATDAILDSGYIKKSSAFTSYGKSSSFFFAGVPTLGEMAMNLPKLANKLEAVRIIPTDDVLDNFKYRFANDQALMWEGDFNYKELGLKAEKAYFILENNNGNIQYKEVTKNIYDEFNGKGLNFLSTFREGVSNEADAVMKNTGAMVTKGFK